MATLLLLARLVLAPVFLVAGIAKLADLPGSRRALHGFGVPPRLAAPLGLLLPLAELAVAVALLPTGSAWLGALGALLLLLVFVVGISTSLARGRQPDCHCFGQLHSAPVGWPTLTRNGLLAALAAFVVVGGYGDAGPSAVDWIGALRAGEQVGLVAVLVLAVVVAVQGWLVFQLLQQQGRTILRLDELESGITVGAVAAQDAAPAAPHIGLPVDSPAPGFSFTGLYGETMTLDALRAPGQPVILIFSDPDCGPCTTLLPELGQWQREHGARLTLAVLSRGTIEENRVKSSEHGVAQVLLQPESEAQIAYQVRGTPSAVLVQPDGTIGSGVAEGSEQIRALVAQVAAIPAAVPENPFAALPAVGCGDTAMESASALQFGEPAPAVTLPDLAGKMVSLSRFRGRPTLVLFWNPGCGFCARMLDDLKAWERDAPKDGPRLLLISTGGADANRAMGLRGTIVLDDTFGALRAFGATGTPSGILVDDKGRIASELAVGADAFLALAHRETGSVAG